MGEQGRKTDLIDKIIFRYQDTECVGQPPNTQCYLGLTVELTADCWKTGKSLDYYIVRGF